MLLSFSALEPTILVSIRSEFVDLTCRARRDGDDEISGTDTLVIRDGLIQIQRSTVTPRARR